MANMETGRAVDDNTSHILKKHFGRGNEKEGQFPLVRLFFRIP